jgi:ariadne-1
MKCLIFQCVGCMFWVTGYIHTAINDGPGCLSLRCADPPCEAIVGEDLVYELVSEDDRRKYSRYLLRSYVEDNRKVRFFCCLFMSWFQIVDFSVQG